MYPLGSPRADHNWRDGEDTGDRIEVQHPPQRQRRLPAPDDLATGAGGACWTATRTPTRSGGATRSASSLSQTTWDLWRTPNRRPHRPRPVQLQHAGQPALRRDNSTCNCVHPLGSSGCRASRLPARRLSCRPGQRGHQLVDCSLAHLHLRAGRHEAGISQPMAGPAGPHLCLDEPPVAGRRPMPGQQMTRSRVAPPSNRSQHRIDSCSDAAPDAVHPASA
jgi:hypothetical protein